MRAVQHRRFAPFVGQVVGRFFSRGAEGHDFTAPPWLETDSSELCVTTDDTREDGTVVGSHVVGEIGHPEAVVIRSKG